MLYEADKVGMRVRVTKSPIQATHVKTLITPPSFSSQSSKSNEIGTVIA